MVTTSSHSAAYNPTPRTGTKICSLHKLVLAIHPCFRVEMRNSDALICFSSLSTCKKLNTSILKCENIGTDITPPCLSSMCFQRGLLPLLLSTSSTYCEPLWKIFFPVSPAYLDSTWRLHTMHSIWLPSPVFLHIPSSPVLHVKHFSLPQCSFSL